MAFYLLSHIVVKKVSKETPKLLSTIELESMASDFFIASKHCEIGALESLLKMSKLVSAVSDVIHAVQRERGASNLYVGSHGAEFKSELNQVRLETDGLVVQLVEIFKSLNLETGAEFDRTRLLNRLAHAAHDLASLSQVRGKVDSLELNPNDLVEAYSELVRILLSIIFESADAAVNPKISKCLAALFNLMEGKEFAGQERAAGTAAFAGGVICPTTRDRILRLIEEQEHSFQMFEEFGEEDIVIHFKQKLLSTNLIQMEKLRRIACSAGEDHVINKDFGRTWFTCTSERIDHIKETEVLLVAHLKQLCESKLKDAHQNLKDKKQLLDREFSQNAANEGRFVIFCGKEDWAEGEGITPEIGGLRLGRSLLEIVKEQANRLHKLNTELSAVKAALEERKLIDKAKGLLMKHRNMNEPEAHKLLRDIAMKRSCRMTEIAKRIIELDGIWV